MRLFLFHHFLLLLLFILLFIFIRFLLSHIRLCIHLHLLSLSERNEGRVYRAKPKLGSSLYLTIYKSASLSMRHSTALPVHETTNEKTGFEVRERREMTHCLCL